MSFLHPADDRAGEQSAGIISPHLPISPHISEQEAGIIFRDLKPENVMVGMDGHLKLTDFGMSKRFDAGRSMTTGTICGTPEYLAPEVLQGKPYDAAVDWRAAR